MNKRKSAVIFISVCFVGTVLFLFANSIHAATPTDELGSYVQAVDQIQSGMTLGQMVKAGGVFTYILVLLSIGVVACASYNFFVLREENIIPRTFIDNVIKNLEKGKSGNVARMCETTDNLLAKILKSGFGKSARGIVYVREAIENEARKEIGVLWQNMSYLSDIATIAPLVGLLGTVIGMIQAFNAIAFQTAVVKPILLAGGVSKAMITTAGGLIVAIPALIFYAYFRGRVQFFSDMIETYAGDVIKILEDAPEQLLNTSPEKE